MPTAGGGKVVTRLIAAGALALASWALQAATVVVAVDVRGGTCRPAPQVTLFSVDGRERASAMVVGGMARLSPGDASGTAPRYLLADCRAYYVAGQRVELGRVGSYRIRLDRAVPPQHRGHGDGVHVRVEDGEGRGPLAGVRVYWLFDDGSEAGDATTDDRGRARLPTFPDQRLPRFILADAGARGYQITGQPVRLWFDDYVLLLRSVTPF